MEKKRLTSRKFHLSLSILIPMIFSGIGALAVLLASHITSAYRSEDLAPLWPIVALVFGMAIFAFAAGLLVMRTLLRPIDKFINTVQSLPPLASAAAESPPAHSEDPIGRYTRVFDQVTEALSKMEAKSLFPEIVGESKAMRSVMAQIQRVAPAESTVLILGESGTGKELVAHSIHEHSPRKGGPFIKLNCAAIPEGLLESELFGHEKGAFTGAITGKSGKFELAHGGTLLLDEIGDMPLSTQAKILRAIEEKEIERVGGTKAINIDIRFIASTNKDLPVLVKTEKFREDLFYRLNAFCIHLPPLRERKEDIPVLAMKFLGISPGSPQLSQEAKDLLMEYHWPGNVRELKHILAKSALFCENGIISARYLPKSLETSLFNGQAIDFDDESFDLDNRLAEIEKRLITQALKKTDGIQARAAELLGINQRSLWHRIRKFGINAKKYKSASPYSQR